MSTYGYRQRVACYVTRTTEAGEELLVLERPDRVGDPSGTQIPAGSMLRFEGLVDAAARRVHEETGLADLVFVEQVGHIERGVLDEGGPSMTNYVHLQAPSDGEPSWEHAVTGGGNGGGVTLACRWEPLPLDFELAGDHGTFLGKIGG